MSSIIIDVREKDEFLTEHVEGAINLPLSDFSTHALALVRHFAGQELSFMCLTGKRAQLALDDLIARGVQFTSQPKVTGIQEWKIKGGKLNRFRTTSLPIFRQIMIVAGGMVAGFTLLGFFLHALFYALAFFVGSGLLLAGISGFCPMAIILAKAPWNKLKSKEMAAGCSATSSC